MIRPSVLVVGLGLSLAAMMAGFAACQPEEPLDLSFATCPNVQPTAGSACAEAGLVCHYFTGCAEYYPATCGADLKWTVEDGCVPNTGGLGPVGGGGTGGGGAPTGGTGGTPAGGQGGSGGGGVGGWGGGWGGGE